VPKSEGGSDDMDNLITLCEDCHNKRHSNPHKTFPEEEDPPDKVPEKKFSPMNATTKIVTNDFRRKVGHNRTTPANMGKKITGFTHGKKAKYTFGSIVNGAAI